MIHIERYGVSKSSPIPHGFRVNVDGLSNAESYELDRQAAQLAIDRYLDHRERLYADSPEEIDGTTLWLVYGLGRSPRIWEEFYVYFLLTKLRIILSEDPQPVEFVGTVDQEVDSALTSLCEEYDVKYYPSSPHNPSNKYGDPFRSGFNGFVRKLLHPFLKAFTRIQYWLIYFTLIVVRSVVLKLYELIRRPVEVRFWLHPLEPHRNRLFDAPADLESRGRRIGYALYDYTAMNGLHAFIRRGVLTLRRAFDPDQPINVEWYADPAAVRRAIVVAPRICNAIQRAAEQAREKAECPEFTYLTRQLDTVSTDLIFQFLFIENAIEEFSKEIDDDAWCLPRSPTKLTTRLISLAGDQEDITTVAVIPRYHSDTRISCRFTNSGVEGKEAIALPDLCVVFEPLSAKTLRGENLPSKIVVARDKVETEACTNDGGNGSLNRLAATASSFAPTPPCHPIRVLIILEDPVDNLELVNAIKCTIHDFPDVRLVFKPHPFYPPDESLFTGLTSIDFEVTPPDASLANLVQSCDICIAMYSTATFPALSQATPIIWVPFASPNHIWMDLMDEVGIRADDPEDIVDALKRLVRDDTFYNKNATECSKFAHSKLIPNTDAPTLADLLDGADSSS